MPVEINELHVKIQVSNKNHEGDGNVPLKAQEKEELIRSCVEAVLEILEFRKMR